MRVALYFSAILMLSACAKEWHKPGADATALKKDLSECEYEAAKSSESAWNQETLSRKCMKLRGYIRQPVAQNDHAN